jgi:hypothetical protein
MLHFSNDPLTSFYGVTMKQLATVTFAVIALVAQTAQAGHLGFGGGGLGLGGHYGNSEGGGRFGGFAGFGEHGGFGLDAERLQIRFEDKFSDLQTDYDTGLAEIDDFYTSDDYSAIVDGLERLVDRYDLFLSGVERSIERLGDVISIANDDLTFYDELIAEYEAREDISAERLERVLNRLTSFQDHLTTKIDSLTEKQTTLSESLSLYESFSTDLSSYLTEIVTAGGGTTDDSSDDAAAAILAASALRSTAPLDFGSCDMSEPLDASVAPEPTAQLLGLAALLAMTLRRPRRRSG